MNSERVTIANINQFIALAKKEPSLLNVGGLSIFRSYVTVANSEGCSKCSKRSSKITEMRPQFEAALSVLSATEQQRMKALLATNSICYYRKEPNGQLSLNCF